MDKNIIEVLMIRYEFIDSHTSDANIHPGDIFQKEKELAYEFIEENKIKGTSQHFLFKRYNIPYSFDLNKNLVAGVNISADLYKRYFYSSKLSQLRASEEYQNNVKELRSHTWKMYVEWIEGRIFRYLDKQKHLSVLDFGSRTLGWIDELRSSNYLSNLSLINTLPPVKADQLTIKKYDVVIALNVIQREQKPEVLLSNIHNYLDDKGIAVLSFRSGTGFDVLALKEKNKSILPLDHLFLPSISGMEKLLNSNGFELLEITTPGQLDAEIVKNSVLKGECVDPLINHLVETVPVSELQSFIQKNNLSSHVRVVFKKSK